MTQCTFEKVKSAKRDVAKFAMFVDWSINMLNLAVNAQISLIQSFIKPSTTQMYQKLAKEQAKPR